ncbi:alpha/beta fold hydrolase [Paenibacillus oenotherae]|uniref:Alpha/beta fold hydrolase n=1 Tax=Paenibacillus oenotherae TaxID=1435645 RepID=A0ABS7D8V6_9BACL|nr:alpha/beta fold hydrolase [Paenibacillus oenotherae]MBW7476375.1 alpha/beta fold hydrolase [Paenibacillus oenotherae]
MKRPSKTISKAVVGTSLAVLLSMPTVAGAVQHTVPGAEAQGSVSVSYNAPAVQAKQVMVPAKAVAESLGAKVKWDAKSRAATIARGEVIVVVTVGKAQAVINGKPANAGQPVAIKDSKVMVPLAFINAAFGTDVQWNAAAGAASFEKDDYIGLAGAYIYHLFNGQNGKAAALMNDELKKALPESVLTLLAQQIQSAVGQPLMQKSAKIKVNAVHTNVEMTYETKGASADFTIRFDANGRIDDLSIKPASIAAAYSKPAYDLNNYTEQEVAIGEGIFALPGTLTMPKGEGLHPVVILVHGSGPNDRDSTIGGTKVFKDIAAGLASHNIAVLRYDKVTREHPFKVSTQPKFTIKNESVDDVIQAIQLVKNKPGIDPSRIYIAGHSQGGYVMPMILADDSAKDIAGAILLSAPSEQMTDVLIEQQNNALERLQQLGAPEATIAAQKGAAATWKGIAELVQDSRYSKDNLPQNFPVPPAYWWFEQRDYIPAEIAQGQTKPMLVLQGENDWQVSMKQYEGWKEALKSRTDVSYLSYPKVNHLLVEYDGLSVGMEYNNPANVSAAIIKDIADWIGKSSSK